MSQEMTTMEAVPQDVRLVRRAYWLIKLRWIAAAMVALGTFFCVRFANISLTESRLYGIAVLLAFYNVAMLVLLNRFSGSRGKISHVAVRAIVNFQVSADLLILAVMLHFSGGIENPFVFYFVFHMVISSILLPTRESYLQATLAVLLFGLLVLLEYKELIPHHCLEGFVAHCQHKDGSYILGTFIAFATGVYLMVYMASYIATRLRRAERAYRSTSELLQEKDQIKDEYVMRLTHDIKGDLAAIQTCLDVVIRGLRGPIEAGPGEFVNRAYVRSQKVTHFVRALLRLTHMRLSGGMEMENFSLTHSIRVAVDTARSGAVDSGVSLSSDVEPSLGEIVGNQFSIEEMITNLLLNAVKYTPQGGYVVIKASGEGRSVLVEISDTGIGIPESETERIFEEFFRTSNAKRLVKDGTGLGLSICKQIAESHGGSIWFESEEGVGTTFRVRLPRTQDQS